MPGPTVRVTLTNACEVDAPFERRLARLLKIALRSLSLKCLSTETVSPATEEPMRTRDERQEQIRVAITEEWLQRALKAEAAVKLLAGVLDSFGVIACTPEWDEARRKALQSVKEDGL